ncbi:hypothetical protein BH11ACT8_BH11ACT8_02820 [soil metagenome]
MRTARPEVVVGALQPITVWPVDLAPDARYVFGPCG